MNRKDKTYLKIATEIAGLSKDKETKVGAVIVDKDGKVVSMGYNGSASCMNDGNIPHSRKLESVYFSIPDKLQDVFDTANEVFFDTNKYPYMLHAEQNSILTSSDNHRLKGATIYITHYPCNVCSNMIAQTGIKRIVCYDDRVGSLDQFIKESLYIIQQANLKLDIVDKV